MTNVLNFSLNVQYGDNAMHEPITLSFVGTRQLKSMLEQWAKEEDRSISAVMRQILQREALRREVNNIKYEEMNKVN